MTTMTRHILTEMARAFIITFLATMSGTGCGDTDVTTEDVEETILYDVNGDALVPPTLRTMWNFGGPLCSLVQVTDVWVHVFDEGGAEVAESVSPCTDGESHLIVPDGLLVVEVYADGADVWGDATYFGSYDIQIGTGDRLSEMVTLTTD